MANGEGEPRPAPDAVAVDQLLREIGVATLLRERAAAAQKPSSDAAHFLGMPIAIVASLAAGLLTGAVALIQWRASVDVERSKAENDFRVEKSKAENALILKALETGDSAQAAANLQFMAKAGLIGLDPAKLASIVANDASRPVLPTAGPSAPYSPDLKRQLEADAKYTVSPSSGVASTVTFTDGWDKDAIISVPIPQLAKVGGPASVQFNKLGAKPLQDAFAEVERRGLLPHLKSFCGSFAPRTVAMRRQLSAHALGIAIDLNCSANAQENNAALAPAFEAHGFFWGGSWTSVKDWSHFELNRPAGVAAPSG